MPGSSLRYIVDYLRHMRDVLKKAVTLICCRSSQMLFIFQVLQLSTLLSSALDILQTFERKSR